YAHDRDLFLRHAAPPRRADLVDARHRRVGQSGRDRPPRLGTRRRAGDRGASPVVSAPPALRRTAAPRGPPRSTTAMTGAAAVLLAIGTEGMRYLWALSQLDWGSTSLGVGGLVLRVAG